MRALGRRGCSLHAHRPLFLLVPGEDEEMADVMEDMGVRSVSTSSAGGCALSFSAILP